MKKFKSLLIAIALIIGATSFVNAQSEMAHVDTQALMESMPEMKAAQNQLEKLQKTYDTEIKAMAKENLIVIDGAKITYTLKDNKY